VDEEVHRNPNEGGSIRDKAFPQTRRGIDRIFAADASAVFKAILAVLQEMKEPVSLADMDKGLINTGSINVSNGQLREIVAKEFLEFLGNQDGRYILSFEIKGDRGKTRVTVTPLIIVNMPVENPLGGRPVASNGSLENQHLRLLSARLP
jgi:hypothetical protein